MFVGVTSVFWGLVGEGFERLKSKKKHSDTLLNVNIYNSKVEEIRVLFFSSPARAGQPFSLFIP